MSGRGHGRGSINMTQAELTNLINTRVAEALAAYQAGMNCTKYFQSCIVNPTLTLVLYLLSFSAPKQPACLYVQNVYGLQATDLQRDGRGCGTYKVVRES